MRPDPKLVIGLLAFAVLVLAASLLAGLLRADVGRYAGFGLLLASAAIALAAALALRVPTSAHNAARAGWLAATVVALIVGVALGGEVGDTVLTYAMVALGFPVSLIVAPLAAMALAGATRQPGGLIVLWLVLAAAGYAQWYVLLPRIFRRGASS